jgi:hypothetical protein
VRITPTRGTQRSLGVIVGSYLAPGVERKQAEEKGLAGYVAILDGGTRALPLRSFEAFPRQTRLYLSTSDIVGRDPSPNGRANFRWVADGIGELTAESVTFKMPQGASLNLKILDTVPWSKNGLGPEGFVSLFRTFPLHWFVHSLRSRVEFDAQLPSEHGSGVESIKGEGLAHFEKNWGVSFPPAYVWLQATEQFRQRSIALAGGYPLKLGAVRPEAWLVGYRSEKYSVDFAPQNPGTFFESRVDACQGSFELTSAFMNRRLVIRAVAPRKTFGGIAIPKNSGFEKNGSEQSFQTQITAQLFEVTPFSPSRVNDQLLEETVFSDGALEFGSEFKCGYLIQR